MKFLDEANATFGNEGAGKTHHAFLIPENELWTAEERAGICDVALMAQTRPNELHRAKKTLHAVLDAIMLPIQEGDDAEIRLTQLRDLARKIHG